MPTAARLSVALYCLVGLALVLLGLRYVFASEYMPYHAAVIDTPWNALEPLYQVLFLGLLKGFGSGAFCVGLATMLLTLIPLRAGMAWAYWVVPLIVLTYTGLLSYVTYFALLPGSAPIRISMVLCGLVVLAVIASLLGRESPGGS